MKNLIALSLLGLCVGANAALPAEVATATVISSTSTTTPPTYTLTNSSTCSATGTNPTYKTVSKRKTGSGSSLMYWDYYEVNS